MAKTKEERRNEIIETAGKRCLRRRDMSRHKYRILSMKLE